MTVVGAGPAGSAAAISARLAGAGVCLYEKSRFPRHKVCGEFFSPEIVPLLEKLGASQAFFDAKPSAIRQLELHFPKATKRGKLPEPAFGLTRFRFDRLMLDRALELGAGFERAPAPSQPTRPVVMAAGRRFEGKRGGRLFGFKTHFTGPQLDSVALYFFEHCYVGVNCAEDGLTNVCGLGPEEILGRHGFDPESLIAAFAPLRERVAPLRRVMDWLVTGPLYFRNRLEAPPMPGYYHAGDQLSFVDPFTGTGMLSALLSGSAAGIAAATGQNTEAYLRATAKKLRPAVRVSSVFRWAIESGWADRFVNWIPAEILVGWTRPHVGS